MGRVIYVKSSSWMLPATAFPDALRALHGLAKDRPYLFENAQQVLAATDLVQALKAGEWAAHTDANGNLVGLRYMFDKAPLGATVDENWPQWIVEALAPFTEEGDILLTGEDLQPRRLSIRRGELYSS